MTIRFLIFCCAAAFMSIASAYGGINQASQVPCNGGESPVTLPALCASSASGLTFTKCYQCPSGDRYSIQMADCACKDDEISVTEWYAFSGDCELPRNACRKRESGGEQETCPTDAEEKCLAQTTNEWHSESGLRYEYIQRATFNKEECKCTTRKWYRCPDGYYGMPQPLIHLLDCRACPKLTNNNATRHSIGLRAAQTFCYVENGTEVTDHKGTFYYSDDCCFGDDDNKCLTFDSITPEF